MTSILRLNLLYRYYSTPIFHNSSKKILNKEKLIDSLKCNESKNIENNNKNKYNSYENMYSGLPLYNLVYKSD